MYDKDAWRYNDLSEREIDLIGAYIRTRPDLMQKVQTKAKKFLGDYEYWMRMVYGPYEDVFGKDVMQENVVYWDYMEWLERRIAG